MNDIDLRTRMIESAERAISEADHWMAAFDESTPEHVKAAYVHGLCYDHGILKPKNVELMVKHYTAAAERGHAGACYMLARAHLHGTKIPQNFELATRYASIPIDYESTIYDTPYYKQYSYESQIKALLMVIKKVVAGEV